MRKPLIHSLLLALVFLSSACGNAKFNGKGKKKDKKDADVVVTTPVDECKEGDKDCPTTTPSTPPVDDCKEGNKECPTTTPPTPPFDDCKDKDDGKDCPVPPKCDDPAQTASQNPGQDPGKTCPPEDDAGQNNPTQSK